MYCIASDVKRYSSILIYYIFILIYYVVIYQSIIKIYLLKINKNAQILHDICPKNIFRKFFWGGANASPDPPLPPPTHLLHL